MTVNEMEKLIENEQTFVLIDSDSCVEVFSEREANSSSYQNVRDSKWKRFEGYKECEVLGIRAQSSNEVALYINAPARRMSSYLDVTYSICVELDVPVGEDEHAIFKEYAEEKLKTLPSSIEVSGLKWELTDNNKEWGSYYDMIEEM